jgi:hypothetical protein
MTGQPRRAKEEITTTSRARQWPPSKQTEAERKVYNNCLVVD